MHTRLKILLPFIIVLLGLLAYLSSFNGVFVLDDTPWIVNSSRITSISSYLYRSTRPLTALSVAFNYRLSGEIPTDYHAFNLLIHLLAGLLLYGVVRRTLELPSLIASYGKYSKLIAFFSATLWVVHPLQTESVTYIIQRAESLMGFFYLLTLYLAIRGFSSVKKYAWFAGAAVACALGMMSKPIMVTAPILVLLYDVIFVSKSWRTAIRSNLALYLGLFLTWGILAFLVLMPNESSGSTGLSLKAITPLGYLATQQGVIVHYLKLIIWPHPLCLDYAWPPALSVNEILLPALLIMVLVLVTAVLVLKKHPVGFCLAWFFIILAPSSSIIPISDYAVEHRTYLSLAGITTLFTLLFVLFMEKILSKRNLRLHVTALSSILLMFIVAAFMARTIARNNDYASQFIIMKKTIEVNPYNFRARSLMINSFMDAYEFVEAEMEARASLINVKKMMADKSNRVNSLPASCSKDFYPFVNNQIGAALLCQDRNEEAITFFQDALEFNKNTVIARYNMAVALHGLGRDEDALREVLLSIDIEPKFIKSYTLAGILMLQADKNKEAISYFEKAVYFDDSSIIAKLELAWLLATIGNDNGRDGQRALVLALEVCKITGGGNYRALDVLAAAYAAVGDFPSAEKTAIEALKLSEEMVEITPETFDDENINISSSPDNIKKRIELYRAGKAFYSEQLIIPTASQSGR